jgi:hypothetical protein
MIIGDEAGSDIRFWVLGVFVLSELMRSFRGGYARPTTVVVELMTEDQTTVCHQSPGGRGGALMPDLERSSC